MIKKAAALPLALLALAVAGHAAPDSVRPLLIGETIPAARVITLEGKETDLAAELKGKHSILVFYRGGWCPYCNRHLSALGAIKGKLKELGWTMAAISPDRPSELLKTKGKNEIDYALYSDDGNAAARAFGLAFTLEKKKLKKYKDHGIDLIWASGKTHDELPVPAVYLIDPEGKVLFQYANQDYKVRLDGDVLMTAAVAYGP